MYNNDQHIMDSFTDDDYITDSYGNENNIYYNKQSNCEFYVERVEPRDKVQQDRGLCFLFVVVLSFGCFMIGCSLSISLMVVNFKSVTKHQSSSQV